MKIRQFANLPSIKTLKIAAISSLAVGVATSISAAPAGAVSITSGNLIITDGVQNINVVGGGSITPAAGTRFTAGFNLVNSATVLSANGSFATAGLSSGPRYIASSSVDYLSLGGGTYTQVGDLVFNIAQQVTSSPSVARLVIGNGSSYSAVAGSGRTTFSFLSGNTTFQTFPDNTLSQISLGIGDFAFDVENIGRPFPTAGANGSYSLTASAVPEPFTIIGTIIGGTAAFRMRKKLSSSAKNAKN
jgi:hypothetical protein